MNHIPTKHKPSTTLGIFLLALREKNHLAVREVALQAGLNFTTYYSWETGTSTSITLDWFICLAKPFRLTPKQLFSLYLTAKKNAAQSSSQKQTIPSA